MNQKPELRVVETICDHCGLPVPSNLIREGEEKQFCCSGCQQVYEILHDWGFDEFYERVDREDASPAKISGKITIKPRLAQSLRSSSEIEISSS